MKRIGVFALVVFFLAACSKDDPEGFEINISQLTKKWYYQSTIFNTDIYPYDDHEPCGKDYIEFLSDGVVRQIDVWECQEDIIFRGQWFVEGNKITISNNGEFTTATIIKLTDSQLDLQMSYDFDGDGVQDTVLETFTSN